MKFLRDCTETCAIYTYENLALAKFGDIVYDEKEEYRANGRWIINPDGRLIKLSEMGPGQGDGGIGTSITRYIENPLLFFADEEVWAVGSLHEIYLDAAVHQAVLRTLTDGRYVSARYPIVWCGPSDGNRCYLRKVERYDGSSVDILLNKETHESYLSGEPFTGPDPQMDLEDVQREIDFVKTLVEGLHYEVNFILINPDGSVSPWRGYVQAFQKENLMIQSFTINGETFEASTDGVRQRRSWKNKDTEVEVELPLYR